MNIVSPTLVPFPEISGFISIVLFPSERFTQLEYAIIMTNRTSMKTRYS